MAPRGVVLSWGTSLSPPAAPPRALMWTTTRLSWAAGTTVCLFTRCVSLVGGTAQCGVHLLTYILRGAGGQWLHRPAIAFVPRRRSVVCGCLRGRFFGGNCVMGWHYQGLVAGTVRSCGHVLTRRSHRCLPAVAKASRLARRTASTTTKLPSRWCAFTPPGNASCQARWRACTACRRWPQRCRSGMLLRSPLIILRTSRWVRLAVSRMQHGAATGLTAPLCSRRAALSSSMATALSRPPLSRTKCCGAWLGWALCHRVMHWAALNLHRRPPSFQMCRDGSHWSVCFHRRELGKCARVGRTV